MCLATPRGLELHARRSLSMLQTQALILHPFNGVRHLSIPIALLNFHTHLASAGSGPPGKMPSEKVSHAAVLHTSMVRREHSR